MTRTLFALMWVPGLFPLYLPWLYCAMVRDGDEGAGWYTPPHALYSACQVVAAVVGLGVVFSRGAP